MGCLPRTRQTRSCRPLVSGDRWTKPLSALVVLQDEFLRLLRSTGDAAPVRESQRGVVICCNENELPAM